ncbi:amidase family protein [Pseudonocardia halophobica]|uniref:Amidase n=1 Tax=Pseudonocardia halophobica TaxID=29401 RepID=A0A9W6L3F2_9PSEU|nr:amidase family protein [Pseudonocardia halophobica]GLL12232.1 amidase [Pseudonocardia halophobica]
MTAAARYTELDAEEYRAASGLELGRRVAAGEISPVHLAELALGLAAEAEPALNAYAVLLPERARAAAVHLEAEVRAGRVRSPLHGVPIAVKDNMLEEGLPAGKGSLTSSDTPAAASSPMVGRLLDAGTVVIGRTTTPEFGWKGTGISPRTGVTRNPWDPTRSSGGSSAGSGATVGSGAVPIATGTDAGGSVRIPAAFCGAVGLKPTLGAVPVWPGTVNENLSHAGPITRDVRDARAVLDLTRGPDARDPQSYWSRPPAPDSGRRLRIGVVRAPFGIAPEAPVGRVVDPALDAVVAAGGAEYRQVELPAALPRAVFEALWVTGRGLGFRDLAREHAAVMDPGLVRLGPLAETYSLGDYYEALAARRAFNTAMARTLDKWDLLVMPTMPLTAFAADAEVPEGGEADAPLPWITWTPYTYPFNITGQPAVTVPCGLAGDGLPVALQVVGPWAHDDRVLGFAAHAQDVLGPARAASRPRESQS